MPEERRRGEHKFQIFKLVLERIVPLTTYLLQHVIERETVNLEGFKFFVDQAAFDAVAKH